MNSLLLLHFLLHFFDQFKLLLLLFAQRLHQCCLFIQLLLHLVVHIVHKVNQFVQLRLRNVLLWLLLSYLYHWLSFSWTCRSLVCGFGRWFICRWFRSGVVNHARWLVLFSCGVDLASLLHLVDLLYNVFAFLLDFSILFEADFSE